LEQDAPFDPQQHETQAIVVMGAGRYFNAPEYGGDTISWYALERTRYAAHLARNTGVPVLTSGGNPGGDGASEAALMKAVLEQEFHVPVRWNILAPQGIKKIALITHAWHMPRARQAFIKAGFEVIPAPMGFTTAAPFNILHLLPSAGGLSHTRLAMHEWIGIVWYRLRGAS
jgi:uncharacterized SAM-binding protein YcdF (DUF218 family)